MTQPLPPTNLRIVGSSAPVISLVSSGVPNETSATITWTTDKAADSQVDWGDTESYGFSSHDASMVTSHSIVLDDLIPDTMYHFRVESSDALGNCAISADFAFITVIPETGPVTSFTLTSPSSGMWPFTLGLAFKDGDVLSSPVLDLLNYQVTVTRLWNSG